MQKISHMNILQKADLIKDISDNLQIENKNISKYDAYIKATNQVREMEREEYESSITCR